MAKGKRPPPRNRPKRPSAARPATRPARATRPPATPPPAVTPPAVTPPAAAPPVTPSPADDAPLGGVPRPLRIACAILALEALALAGLGLFLLYRTAFGHPDRVGTALLDAGAALAGAVALACGARALLRLRPAARTPMVVLQVLSIPVSYTIAFQAERVALGGPIFVAALAVIYLLFTPPVRAALDRP